MGSQYPLPLPSTAPATYRLQTATYAPAPATVVGAAQAGAIAAPQDQPTQVRNVTFVSGGVDQDSQRRMRAVSSRYNLRLVFARQGSGAFFANVPVQILDFAGNAVLNTVSPGPCFYALVPPGRYTVIATHEGRTISRTADVTGYGGVEMDYYWATS